MTLLLSVLWYPYLRQEQPWGRWRVACFWILMGDDCIFFPPIRPLVPVPVRFPLPASRFPLPELSSSSSWIPLINHSINNSLCANLGCHFLCGPTPGPRPRTDAHSTIQTGAVISILGVILQASAVRLSMMLIGRIVSGVAIGMMSVGVPVYLAECAYGTEHAPPPKTSCWPSRPVWFSPKSGIQSADHRFLP